MKNYIKTLIVLCVCIVVSCKEDKMADKNAKQEAKKIEIDPKKKATKTEVGTANIHDIWILERIDNVAANEVFTNKEAPFLEVNTKTKRLMGTTGCYEYYSNLKLDGHKISLSEFVSMEKACNQELSIEKEFLNQLKQIDSFSVAPLKLIFSTKEKNILEFKKVD
ncbi:META domain-containing protein [Croceivirga radicis]|nr:META domain-containing protein [Croceivirga radicis]